ncbi:DUF2119 domain-containing protein [Methanosarcinales archaeon]|nr:MAG: DUF2119 domain-containing protein [Methanosarcinales archaeon]
MGVIYHTASSGEGPVKLFVGGLHGREGDYTAPILEELALSAENDVFSELSLIVPRITRSSRYMHVLSEAYYQSIEGQQLLHFIEKYKPSFYCELHAYGKESYFMLVNPEREKQQGVPPFVDLEDGVLLGSIAPILRRRFGRNDLCITIEIPNWKTDEVREMVLELLRIVLGGKTKEGTIEALRRLYPRQIEIARSLFHRYLQSGQ